MTLVELILKIGVGNKVKYAQLPAQKCFDEPTKGFQVVNKKAPLVVKDCAFVAVKYLPVLVFNMVDGIVDKIRDSKVTDKMLQDFIKVKDEIGMNELFLSILDKGADYQVVMTTPTIESSMVTDVHDDIYGGYYDEDVEIVVSGGSDFDKLKAILIN